MTTIGSTSDDVRVAEIAAGLTDAQRKTLTGAWRDPLRHGPYHVFCLTPGVRSAWLKMIPLGLVNKLEDGCFDLVVQRNRTSGAVVLSDFGLAVRAHLFNTKSNYDG